MKKTVIVYASHDGQTLRISETIKEHLRVAGIHADLLNVAECNANTATDYDVLIFGASIRYGKHLKAMLAYLTTHLATLKTKQTAFFSVNLTARKDNRNTPETSNYIKKLLAKLDWQPNEVDVFAGKLNYPHYGFFDKHIIRFIMWITKGPTDPKTVQEFTDWARVEMFSARLIKRIQT